MPITRHIPQPTVKLLPFCVMRLQDLIARSLARGSTLAVLTVSCVWLLMVLVANPVGEFPLNDDWSYSRAVQSLVDYGRLEFTGFTSMPLIAQVLWGTLFSLPFGFSFSALRLSTIILGLLGLLATYGLLRETRADRSEALGATMVVAANPLYFQLSMTFMSDVPFFTVSMLAFLFLLRSLRSGKQFELVVGYSFAGAAILIRQLGIVIPISFLIAYLVLNKLGRRAIRNALVPMVALIALLYAYPVVLERTIGLPSLYGRSFEPITEALLDGVLQLPLVLADRLFVESIYLGLFLLPFLIAVSAKTQRAYSQPARRLQIFTWPVLFALMLGLLLWQGRTMPLGGNVLFDIGLGPALLRDTYLLRLPHWPTAPPVFWLIATVFAVLGSVLLVNRFLTELVRIARSLKSGSNEDTACCLFMLSATVAYAFAIGVTGFLDRYLIWLLPLLMCLSLVKVAPRDSARPGSYGFTAMVLLSAAVGLVFVNGLFAVAGTHDFLSWNRARWQGLMDLMKTDGVSYRNMDGGFEFNGWYAYNATYQPRNTLSWWWVESDEYMVSFGPMTGYIEMRRYSFERWIPPEQGYIFMLQRVGESTDQSLVEN